MPSRIVTSTYRYKRPPRKRKAVHLQGPAIVRKGAAKPKTTRRRPTMTASRRSSPRDARGEIIGRTVPDMTLEEHQRRGDAADALFREIVHRATAKD